MKRLVISSSLVLAFSLYILASPPDIAETVITPAAVVRSTSSLGIASPKISQPVDISPKQVAPTSSTKTLATAPVAKSSSPRLSPQPSEPAPVAQAPAPKPKPAGQYKDGTYAGGVADAYYGNVQVQVAVSGGKVSNVSFLDYPQDRGTSRMINSQAMPILISEAIQAQSANVNVVSGATATSEAFQQSLASALSQARA